MVKSCELPQHVVTAYWDRTQNNFFTPTANIEGGNRCLSTRKRKTCANILRQVRTGGVMVAVTGDAVVLDVQQFGGAEHLGCKSLFLARVKELYPQIVVCVHDDACHLRRFVQNQKFTTMIGQAVTYPNMTYVVDKYHHRFHKDEWCRHNTNPYLPEHISIMAGVNTSACELLNARMRHWKNTFKYLHQSLAEVLLLEMLTMWNTERLRILRL